MKIVEQPEMVVRKEEWAKCIKTALLHFHNAIN
jgi:hypothetical protein